MSYIIAIAGKGGVGKTTVTALLVRYLLRKNKPILSIDADPNSNLNILLGMEYSDTIADIREEAKNLSSTGISKTDFFNTRLEEIIIEGEGVDLIVMGRPEGPGCYCAVNNILREYLVRLSRGYKFVIIDNSAGMEHLSRRTADNIDKLLLVSDKTVVSIESAVKAFETAKKSGLKVKDFGLLINKADGDIEERKKYLIEKAGIDILGYIPFFREIQERSEIGKGKLPEIKIENLENIFNSVGA